MLKPFRLYWFPRLRSTNDHAALLRRQGRLYAPAVVLTARQLAGRGRGKNTWWSNEGVLTVTFALPVHDRLAPQELPMIAGLAVRDLAALLTGNTRIALKWPNDVLLDGKKLAGLLCERVSNADLVGIGLNVNVDCEQAPWELREQVTSLSGIAGKTFDLNYALTELAALLHRNIRRRMEQPFSAFVREYARHDGLIGKTVIIRMGGDQAAIHGRCEGVDELGRLMVRAGRVLHRVVAGHVEMTSGQSGSGKR